MTHSRDESLRFLTMDLISPARRVEQAQIDALTAADWSDILRTARQHRIGPMMRWQLQHAHAHLHVPPHISQTLDHLHRRSTARTMPMQRALLRVHDILQAAGIPFVALKGVHLAFAAYPHPALRPLRDLDILVRPEQADAAQATLIAAGLTTIDRFEKAPESRKANEQHLPPLMAGDVMVEVHRRALHLEHNHQQGQDLADDPAFWQRCVSATVAGIRIKAPSPEHQFLHVMVHGVYDHALANGPLMLSDLGFLAQSTPPDWATLRESARRLGFARGLDLALALLQRYWGIAADADVDAATAAAPPTAGAPDTVPESMADTATLLMLRTDRADRDAAVRQSLDAAPTLAAKCRVLLRTAFPSRETIAYACRVHEHSPWLLLCYPRWWWRHASRRLAPLLRGKRPFLLTSSSGQLASVQSWLASGDRANAHSAARADS